MSPRLPPASGRGKTASPAAPPVLLLLAALLAAAAAASEEAAFTGVRGRVALRGEAVAGVVVYAFEDISRGIAGAPAARSAPSDAGGAYELPLEPGRYFLAAARAASGRIADLSEGDLFAFFGGSPVRVERGRPVAVGFSLLPVGRDPDPLEPASLSGVVHGEDGRPLPGASVHLYPASADGFKGMPGATARTREDGTFRARASKGAFFVVVRKRESGDPFGPPGVGDAFGYYPFNPVRLEAGQGRGIRIDAAKRQEAEGRLGGVPAPLQGSRLRVTVVDPSGAPVAGLRVLAYREAGAAGRPAALSGRSGPDGTADLILPEAGTYWLVAREKPGGPPDGEWYGKHGGEPGRPLDVDGSGADGPVTIVVERR